MKTSKARNYPLILVVISLLSIATFIWIIGLTSLNKQQPKAKNGILDLTHWNLQKNGSVQLDGQWEFYWKQLLTSKDFKKNSTHIKFNGYQNVPDSWTHYSINNIHPSGIGYGTYRLKVKLHKRQKILGLKILTISTSYKMFLNNKQVVASGTVGKTSKTTSPQYKTHTITISPTSNEFEIIVQVANFTYSRGGIWHSISLGTDQNIRLLAENTARREMFVFGAMVIMLCYHFSLYWIQKKNKSMIYSALGILIIALRTLVTQEYYITKLFPNMPFSLIVFLEYITIYWGPVTWILFNAELFPKEFPKSILKIFIFNSTIFTLIALLTPISIYTRLLIWIEVYTIGIFLYSFIKVVQALIRKRTDAAVLLFCMVLISSAYIFDALFFWNTINSFYGNISMIAVTITVFLQAYIIALRYSRAFDEAEEYLHKMEYVNQMKDTFLANTSHELRTPLNGIISITESLIHSKNQEFSPQVKQNLNMVINMGQRLSFIIKDLLDFSMMKNNKLLLQKDTFDLFPLIQNIFCELEWKTKNKHLNMNIISQEKSIYITADKYRIIQVIYNLLDNSVKFTPDGGDITVKLHTNRNQIFISVIDTGIGIADNQLDNIFKPFERGELSNNTQYSGIGLGLNISKSIAEAHGGDIFVKNNVSQGTEFTLVLPINNKNNINYIPTDDNTIYRQQIIMPESQKTLFLTGTTKGTIVIIDDQYSNLIGISSTLNSEGYTIKGFTNPKEGLDYILIHREINIAIVDLMMPQLSGYEICKEIREQFSLFELPILILTAKAGDSMIHSLVSGANDILLKPFEREELLARVNTLNHLKTSTEQAIYNEIAMLQSQINPHFLHNALNAIAACCYEDGEKAYDAITTLSDYLQYSYSLSPEIKEIFLSKEIELIKAYLAIEKLRFGDKLNYEIKFEEPESVTLPPFMIQPLVENAVRHGITKKESGGFVKIYGNKVLNYYTITVEDNGHGISDNIMNLILSEKKSETIGIGLNNVCRRLKKRYATDLKIDSIINKGTKVSFSIKTGGIEDDSSNNSR